MGMCTHGYGCCNENPRKDQQMPARNCCHRTSGFRRAPLAARRPESRSSVACASQLYRLERLLLDRTYTDSRRTSAMRVCQPGPVAFQRANVSGGSRRLIAIFESEDFGRPRGLSIAAAVRAPKILGKTSLAGRAFAIIAADHSGFTLLVFLGLDCFFISIHLAFVCFAQTDHPGLAVARCEYHAMQPVLNKPKHAVAPFAVVFAFVFPDKGRRPVELFGKVQ